jgi:hypothetical protein
MNSTLPEADLNDFISAKNLCFNDIQKYYNIQIMSKYLKEKAENPHRTQVSIAKDLNYSSSSLSKIKKATGYISKRKVTPKTTEQKNQITAKILATKARNKEFKEQLKNEYQNKISSLCSLQTESLQHKLPVHVTRVQRSKKSDQKKANEMSDQKKANEMSDKELTGGSLITEQNDEQYYQNLKERVAANL